MEAVESPYPPGTVAVCSSEAGRVVKFYPTLDRLKVPIGTTLLYATGCYIHQNRNLAVDQMKGEWLFFLDDDNLFEPDILLRLLAHQRPIIGSLYLRKQHPFGAHIYDLTPQKTEGAQTLCWNSRALSSLPQQQVIAVAGVATSGLLVQRPVLKALSPNPFNHSPDGLVGEDLYFCWRARHAGYPVAVDTGVILGHVGQMIVWPTPKPDGTWGLTLEVGPNHEAFEIE